MNLTSKNDPIKKENAVKAISSHRTIRINFSSYLDEPPPIGREFEPPIGRCWRKRLRFRLRAFADFSFAFCPGGMK
jgi:hypothetical protein